MDSWVAQPNGSKYQIEILSTADAEDRERLQALKSSKVVHFIHDTILDQLKDLLETRNPSITWSDKKLEQAAQEYLDGRTTDEIGNWVFYPWSGRLVHILEKDYFIELRTNRNLYKITKEEQDLLATKTVAVIGLSVGQSISLALCMERVCGKIIIVDYDTLDLSNLNRIRTGVHNLGIPKTSIVAREILEIDPYMEITIFEDGATPDNINQILEDAGRPVDILVDECDSMAMKVSMRQAAKAKRIPVIMDTSDRGQIDIERFDLEPNRPLFHGDLEHINLNEADFSDPALKMAIMQGLIDFSKASPRAVQSFMSIGKTLKTWPQLASSVILGGAVGADICRRILLKESNSSGKYFVELNNLVP